ncbi:hypothetical protein KUA25_04485 [Bacteroidales bacterium MSK.15.36]|nr:hypothetical protein [Bacteroidales bacterium MSK.15.36]
MYKEEIRLEINKLKQELEDNEAEYEDIQDEIANLAYQIDCLESDKYRSEEIGKNIAAKIKSLEKRLANKNFDELDNKLTGDKFRDSFIKASYFCSMDGENEILNHVNIEEDRLIATDGYRGIIIECDEIPSGLKNTFIKWDVRENFKENAKSRIWRIINLSEIIKNTKSNTVLKLEAEEFLEKLYFETVEVNGAITILNYKNIKVAFNKKYLDTLIKVFKGIEMTVYYPKNYWSPLIIAGGGQQAILSPVRLSDLAGEEK